MSQPFQGWRNCQISEHGLTWKQCFFEKYLQEVNLNVSWVNVDVLKVLEAFDPATDDIEELRQVLLALFLFTQSRIP